MTQLIKSAEDTALRLLREDKQLPYSEEMERLWPENPARNGRDSWEDHQTPPLRQSIQDIANIRCWNNDVAALCDVHTTHFCLCQTVKLASRGERGRPLAKSSGLNSNPGRSVRTRSSYFNGSATGRPTTWGLFHDFTDCHFFFILTYAVENHLFLIYTARYSSQCSVAKEHTGPDSLKKW